MTTIITLTQGVVALVDDVDADLLTTDTSWYTHTTRGSSYARRDKCSNGKRVRYFMHRVIAARMIGRPLEKGEEVDHIDGNGLNNTRSNLRVCRHKDNMRNSKCQGGNRSGYKGVRAAKTAGKWQARIHVNGQEINLGTFDDPVVAHDAYLAAARLHFGEFAVPRSRARLATRPDALHVGADEQRVLHPHETTKERAHGLSA